MKHESIVEMLSSYLDGEISVKDRMRVEAHLGGCASCRVELANITAVKSALSSAPKETISDAAAARMMAALEQELDVIPVATRPRNRWRPLPVFGSIAAVLLVAVGLSGFLLNAGGMRAPSSDALNDRSTAMKQTQMEAAAPESEVLGGGGQMPDDDRAAGGAASPQQPAYDASKATMTAEESRALPGPIYSARPVGETDLDGFLASKQSRALFGPHTENELAALRARLSESAKSDSALSSAMKVAVARHAGADITYAEQVLFEGRQGWLMAVQWRASGKLRNEIFVVADKGTILYP